MSNCCCSSECEVEPGARENPHCPDCRRKGRSVGRQTIEHLLEEPLAAEIGEGDYRFCATRNCETVYYAASSHRAFRKPDLKVRVGIRETADPIPICYCFGHTRASAWDEIGRTGSSTVLDSIKQEVKADRCACETRNPSGKCCLGAVTRVVQERLRHLRRQ
jgi:CopZ-like zinc binding protein